MKENNEIYHIEFNKTYGGTGDLANGVPFNTNIQLIKDDGKWFLVTQHTVFSDDSDTRRIVVEFMKDVLDGDLIVDNIVKSVFNNLEESYQSDNFIARYAGNWYLSCNDKLISKGQNYVKVEQIERLKELLDYNSLMKEANFSILEELQDEDDKIRFSLDNRLFDIKDDLSFQEKYEYVRQQIRELDGLSLSIKF